MDGAGRRKLVQKWWSVPLTGQICIVYRVLEVLPCVESSRWKLYCVHNEMNDDVCGWFRSLSLQRPLIKHSLSHLLWLDGSDLCNSFDSKVLAPGAVFLFQKQLKWMTKKKITHLLPLMKFSANEVTAHFAFGPCGTFERKFRQRAQKRLDASNCVFCTLTHRRPCNCHFSLSENGARWLESVQWAFRVTRIFRSFLGQFHSFDTTRSTWCLSN